jgi:hypothetical protein
MANVKKTTSFPLWSLFISLVIYLSAFIASACEFRNDKWVYEQMCRFRSCWPALYEIWVLGISFGVISFVVSLIIFILHYRDSRLKSKISMAFLVLVAIMWLAVMVVGWLPLRISLVAGSNGLPAWYGGNGGLPTWSTSYRSRDLKPIAGIFHYAVAWHRTAVVDATKAANAFRGTVEHGRTALAAVILSNLAL